MVGLAPKWVRLYPKLDKILYFFRSDYQYIWLDGSGVRVRTESGLDLLQIG